MEEQGQKEQMSEILRQKSRKKYEKKREINDQKEITGWKQKIQTQRKRTKVIFKKKKRNKKVERNGK